MTLNKFNAYWEQWEKDNGPVGDFLAAQMKTNVRVAALGNVGIFPHKKLSGGRVSFDVMTNDSGDTRSWSNPTYEADIVASCKDDFEAQVQARYPGASYPWSLKLAMVWD